MGLFRDEYNGGVRNVTKPHFQYSIRLQALDRTVRILLAPFPAIIDLPVCVVFGRIVVEYTLTQSLILSYNILTGTVQP